MSEATKAANKRYYERHKESEKARCKQWRQENKEWYKKWQQENKEKLRANGRRYEYNLKPEEFDAKMLAQEGKCAICKIELINPDVDHDHSCCSTRKTCGKCNRGLLCRSCNTFIGLAKESIEFLNSAIQYLSKYKERNDSPQ